MFLLSEDESNRDWRSLQALCLLVLLQEIDDIRVPQSRFMWSRRIIGTPVHLNKKSLNRWNKSVEICLSGE